MYWIDAEDSGHIAGTALHYVSVTVVHVFGGGFHLRALANPSLFMPLVSWFPSVAA